MAGKFANVKKMDGYAESIRNYVQKITCPYSKFSTRILNGQCGFRSNPSKARMEKKSLKSIKLKEYNNCSYRKKCIQNPVTDDASPEIWTSAEFFRVGPKISLAYAPSSLTDPKLRKRNVLAIIMKATL